MATTSRRTIKCLLVWSSTSLFDRYPEQSETIAVLKAAAKEAGAQLQLLDETLRYGVELIPKAVSAEIIKADLVIALISRESPEVFYEVGFAQALGKPVMFLIQGSATPLIAGVPALVLTYSPTSPKKLAADFKRQLLRFRRNPNRFSTPSLSLSSSLPIIDLAKLGAREFENLCFELFTQMGFRRVEWGKELKEIDVVATLPKKDPDGFEYHELWLIALGLNAPPEMLMDIMVEPEFFFDRLYRRMLRDDKRPLVSQDAPVTLLIISHEEHENSEMFEHQLRLAERRMMKRRYPFSIRLRLWSQQQMVNLIQQYPQLAYKYFSEEARAQSEHRKTADELYKETVELNERLQAINLALTEEREKRIKAERDAVWKDVAFKAAHKLGNPVFALETDLQGIKRRIKEKPEEALAVAQEMEASIEKAKTIIGQFKSLIRAQESVPKAIDIVPLLDKAARVARENGVNVEIHAPAKHPRAFVDPVRITECFDELFANSLHWFDKGEKRITILIDSPNKKELPSDLDSGGKYVRIRFGDNGCGVPPEKKKDIFLPFVTTHEHGTGLGLSMVQRVIDGHHGMIRENGKHGEGAQLEIFLPQALSQTKDS